jgi:peptidoglycan/LPS O-acetylase OafA/YrhL
MERAERSTWNYIPALDGIRGIAILLVIGRHYFQFPFGGGYGVDLFFVLSGFLITSLLLAEHAEKGSISLRGFYSRRARRLLPALFAMLACYLVIAAAGRDPTTDFRGALRAVAAGGFYTANIFQVYWPDVIGRRGVGPLWSLALEEQFYLLSPLLLVLALRKRISQRVIEWTLLGAIAAVVLERIVLVLAGSSYVRMAYSPESRCDGLLAGVLLAFLLRRPRALPPRAILAALLGLTAVVVACPPQEIGGPIIDVVGVVLIATAVTDPGGYFARSLSWRPLKGLGQISYSLYLWHLPVLYWLGMKGVVALPASLAVAYASTRWIERPFRRRRTPSDVEPAPRPVLVGAASNMTPSTT